MTGYLLLSAAIIRQAASDYHAIQQRIAEVRRGGAAWERERCELYLLEQWFESDYCGALTFGQNEKILRSVKKGEL